MKNSEIKILVVDDRPNSLRCLAKMLTEQGYKVAGEVNGQLGLNAAIAEPPNLILLDTLLPDMNGYEVCQKLKQMDKTQKIPIIFLSERDRELDKTKVFKVGGADYLTQPFHPEEVLARIENQLTIQKLQKEIENCRQTEERLRLLDPIVTNQEQEKEIAENKLLEQKLRSSEAQMRAFLEAMTDIVIILDAHANDIKVAPTQGLLVNELSAEIVSSTLEQFFIVPQAETFINQIQQVIKTKQTVNFEYSLPLKGKDIWFSANISPMSNDRVIWVARDITHRVRAELELQKLASELEERVLARTAQIQDANKILIEEIRDRSIAESALRESERRFRAIFNNSFQFTGLLKPDGTLIEANQTALDFAGIQHIEMAGIPFWEAKLWTISRETQEQLKAAIARATTGEFVRYEVDVLGMENKVATIDFSLKPVIDETGEVVLLIPEGRDITDRKQAEAGLQQAKETAETASIAKSRFLSTMSHELRTPLNAILGFTQVMVRDGSSKEHTEYLEIINRSGEHLLKLINDILSMSKIESGRMVLNENSFDLYQLLNSLEELLQLKAKSKGLALIFQYPSNLPQYIQTDESKLRQVLINLLGNAIKFTSQGSVILRVDINKQLITDSKQVAIAFEVEDTGPGIGPDELDILFTPFIQTQTGRQSMEGTGLGLSIGREFVRLLGGEISISSTVGKGATFKFYIQASLTTLASEDKKVIAERIISLEPNRTQALTTEDFKGMPSQWVADLHTAALCINDQRIIELIQLIPQTQAKLSNALTDLVNNFRLDLIINLTQSYNE